MPINDLFGRTLPWVKRLVFLIVLVFLISAASKAVQRWRSETAKLDEQVSSLLARAESASGDEKRKLLDEAASRTASIPSWKNVRWDFVAGSAAMYAIGLIPPAFVLHRCLMAMSVPCSRRRAIAAQLLGHAGKYMPGKAMVVVLRVGGVIPQHKKTRAMEQKRAPVPRSRGHQIVAASSCVFFETLLMMGVGGAVAGVLLWQSPLPAFIRISAALMAIVAVVPVSPPVIRPMLRHFGQRRREMSGLASDSDSSGPAARDSLKQDSSSDDSLNWTMFGRCLLASLLSWLFIGGSFTLLILAIPSFEPIPPVMQLASMSTAAIALGMVLGFASLLPGGAGVREYVTLLVLASVIGATHALLAVLAARLLFIAVEALAASAAYLALRRMDGEVLSDDGSVDLPSAPLSP